MSLRVRARAGRQLSLSPAWPEESARVVFDRHSGDYWLLALPAAALLEQVLIDEQVEQESAVLDELIAASLVQRCSPFDS